MTAIAPGTPTCFIIGRTQSTRVLCRRRLDVPADQHNAVRQGRAHTRRLQGTGTKSIIETHFSPKQRMTCVCEERTASRSHPFALIFRPERRFHRVVSSEDNRGPWRY